VSILSRLGVSVQDVIDDSCFTHLVEHANHDGCMGLGLLHEMFSSLCRDYVDVAVGLDILPTAIRLRLPLEGHTLRVAYVPQLNVVVIFQAIRSCPSSANVITLVFIRESMELRDEVLESSEDLHGVE